MFLLVLDSSDSVEGKEVELVDTSVLQQEGGEVGPV
jgi:hypothetical protein